MLLSDLVNEFLFDCEIRALSELTVSNYRKQLKKFLLYLETTHGVTALEQMRPALIKQYISFLQGCSLKPAYINDLLKAVKCLCRYAFDEGYTKGLITERIKNVKQKKVLIHTFLNKEIAGMIKYYSGNSYFAAKLSTFSSSPLSVRIVNCSLLYCLGVKFTILSLLTS